MTKEYYPLQSSDDERQRLIAQGELLAPLTQRLFEKAGIAAGMRVLDIGSGSATSHSWQRDWSGLRAASSVSTAIRRKWRSPSSARRRRA